MKTDKASLLYLIFVAALLLAVGIAANQRGLTVMGAELAVALCAILWEPAKRPA